MAVPASYPATRPRQTSVRRTVRVFVGKEAAGAAPSIHRSTIRAQFGASNRTRTRHQSTAKSMMAYTLSPRSAR